MKKKITDFFQGKTTVSHNLLCAIFAAAIFSFRWRNCLPFSGYMPALEDGDKLDSWARFLIFTRESFGFPIGVIKGLSFPFLATNITKGPEPLFAVIVKLLSKIYAPLAEFYYFTLAEIVYVFLAAYFAGLLMDLFRVKSFWMKLLGVTLVSLSFPLLHRSSNYYGLTMEVVYVPLFLAFAYFLIRLYKHPGWKTFFLLCGFFFIAGSCDYYPLYAAYIAFLIILGFNLWEFLADRSRVMAKRLFFLAAGFICGVIIPLAVLFVLGNQGNLATAGNLTALTNRYGQGWGYGGGYGGGFHVADVLSLFIPPEDTVGMPLWKKCGPSAYLTHMGFPLTTARLQHGQYEGFVFLGTVAIGLLFLVLLIKLIPWIQNPRIHIAGLKLKLISKFYTHRSDFSLPLLLGLATFVLYILSWGYIIHIAGIRMYNIATPSLIIAELCPKFMLARSLGRLAIPFMLFVILSVVILLDRYLQENNYRFTQATKVLITGLVICCLAAHIMEIRGYLAPPAVVRGNEIANVFGREDQALIKNVLNNKQALLIAPGIRESMGWNRACFALAFYANIPLGDSYRAIGMPLKYLKQFETDRDAILTGQIKGLAQRYGDIGIAVPANIAEKVLSLSDVPLNTCRLHDQDIIIFTLAM